MMFKFIAELNKYCFSHIPVTRKISAVLESDDWVQLFILSSEVKIDFLE